MIYYTATKNSCESVSKKQDDFLGLPKLQEYTITYDIPFKLQNDTKYTLCIHESFYTQLTDTQKSKCTDVMPSGYLWTYED